MGDKVIKDFQVGEDSLIIQLEDDSVYWAGMRYNYQPNQMKIHNKAKIT